MFERYQRKYKTRDFSFTNGRCNFTNRLSPQPTCVVEIPSSQPFYHLTDQGIIMQGAYFPYTDFRSVDYQRPNENTSDEDERRMIEEIMGYEGDLTEGAPLPVEVFENVILTRKDGREIKVPNLGDAFSPFLDALEWILREQSR